MTTPKLGQWIKAHRVRIVKKNGRKVLEIQRTVPKRKNGPFSLRKTKKAIKKTGHFSASDTRDWTRAVKRSHPRKAKRR
jgi:hypothetical protein